MTALATLALLPAAATGDDAAQRWPEQAQGAALRQRLVRPEGPMWRQLPESFPAEVASLVETLCCRLAPARATNPTPCSSAGRLGGGGVPAAAASITVIS